MRNVSSLITLTHHSFLLYMDADGYFDYDEMPPWRIIDELIMQSSSPDIEYWEKMPKRELSVIKCDGTKDTFVIVGIPDSISKFGHPVYWFENEMITPAYAYNIIRKWKLLDDEEN